MILLLSVTTEILKTGVKVNREKMIDIPVNLVPRAFL